MSKETEGKVDTQKVDGLAVFPTVSMGENPGNGHNSAYLHPCETAKWIGMLLEQDNGTVDHVKYIESFVMLCSSVVEMRPDSKGGIESTDKVTSFKDQDRSGQDVDITLVPFADLIKRLPSVKVSVQPEITDTTLAMLTMLFSRRKRMNIAPSRLGISCGNCRCCVKKY